MCLNDLRLLWMYVEFLEFGGNTYQKWGPPRTLQKRGWRERKSESSFCGEKSGILEVGVEMKKENSHGVFI